MSLDADFLWSPVNFRHKLGFKLLIQSKTTLPERSEMPTGLTTVLVLAGMKLTFFLVANSAVFWLYPMLIKHLLAGFKA